MKLPYFYKKSSQIEALVIRIEIARAVLNNIPIVAHTEENLRRISLLKSSLFSARIEGNRLTFDQIKNETNTIRTSNREKKEVFNIISALRFAKSFKGNITSHALVEIHKRVMKGLGSFGEFRKEPSAIFNQAGFAVYMTPPPSQIQKLLERLLEFMNNPSVDPLPIQAAIAHFAFEKIHPFLDGNGRVGRILSMMHLERLGYHFRWIVSFEKYFDEKKADYYYGLSINGTNITEFVAFFLEALATSAENVIGELKNKKEDKIEDTLLPRRAEILAIIRDHKIMSFDQIRRRFLKINPRTLHYDLECLLRENLIRKLGRTRGAHYAIPS